MTEKLELKPATEVPDILLSTLGGTTVSLSDLRGRKVLIYLWGSW